MSGNRRSSRTAKAALRPTFQQIEIFLKVLETRSFVAAARLLGISPPAVSQAIARIEDIYGGVLFVRRRGVPLSLTPVGEAILPAARVLLDTVDHQIARAAAAGLSRVGRLSVGIYPGTASGPLRDGLAAFIRECPDIELRFIEGSAGDLHRRLNASELDVIFTAFLPDLGNAALVQEELWSERLVAVLPEDHDLAGRAELGWRDVARQPIILGSSKGERTGYRAVAARIGKRPFDCRHHDVSRGALLQLVAMGLGITITFPSAVAAAPGTIAIPISDDDADVAIEAIWLEDDNNPIRHRLLHRIRDVTRTREPGGS